MLASCYKAAVSWVFFYCSRSLSYFFFILSCFLLASASAYLCFSTYFFKVSRLILELFLRSSFASSSSVYLFSCSYYCSFKSSIILNWSFICFSSWVVVSLFWLKNSFFEFLNSVVKSFSLLERSATSFSKKSIFWSRRAFCLSNSDSEAT